jgi:hypothetical protein
MRLLLIFGSLVASTALVDAFRWATFRPRTRRHRLVVSEGSSASGDMPPHPPDTPPPSELLQEYDIQPYFLSNRRNEIKPGPAETVEREAKPQISAISHDAEEASLPDAALGTVVNAGTQEELSRVNSDVQAGIAAVSDTIVEEFIVSGGYTDLVVQ